MATLKRRAERATRIVVVGSITRDRNERDGNAFSCIGGVVWHAGATLARLRIDTCVVTRCARRDRPLLAGLEERGVQVVWFPSRATTVFVNRYSSRHPATRHQRVDALADPIDAETTLEAARGAELLYLGPLHPGDLGSDFAAVLRGREHPRLALDVQGHTRLIREGRVEAGLDPGLSELIGMCSFVKASVPEARLVVGPGDPPRLARALAGRADCESLVTAGEQGTWLFAGGHGFVDRGARSPGVDPTGAGDICFAHYLAARLSGAAPEAALRRAVAGRSQQLRDPQRLRLLDPH